VTRVFFVEDQNKHYILQTFGGVGVMCALCIYCMFMACVFVAHMSSMVIKVLVDSYGSSILGHRQCDQWWMSTLLKLVFVIRRVEDDMHSICMNALDMLVSHVPLLCI